MKQETHTLFLPGYLAKFITSISRIDSLQFFSSLFCKFIYFTLHIINLWTRFFFVTRLTEAEH